MERAATSKSPLFGCLLAVCLIIYTSFIGQCHSVPTNRFLPDRVDDLGPNEIQSLLHSGALKKSEKQKFNLGESLRLFNKLNPGHLPFNPKRSQESPTGCPPGITEEECNYELMAVWVRMLMKQNQ